jgi:GT2 family glycosyltransferase
MTCHNRQEKTLACLLALLSNEISEDIKLNIILVDDGSTDGTTEFVRARFPQVHIINGDGSLFWNGGMRVAFDTAMANGADFYLWLNDDTLLYPTALQFLLITHSQLLKQQRKNVIVVGSTQDEVTNRLTYGGVVRPDKLKPTAFKLIAPREVPVKCDTMNGNCVLIPNEIAQSIGGMEPEFAHAMGDLDYGLRAGYAGFSVWVMPGFVGTCANNPATGSFNDAALPVAVRLRKMLQPKGVPLRSWRVFTQRHAGVFWPIYWLWPYVNVVVKGLFGKWFLLLNK